MTTAPVARFYRTLGRRLINGRSIDEGLLSAVDPRAVVRVTSRTDSDDLRVPFTNEAAAPSNSLYVDDGGRVGLGTATPVLDVHIRLHCHDLGNVI